MIIRLLLLILALSLLSGCSVLEEINKLGGGEVAAEEQDDANCENGSAGEGCPKKSVNGWANVKSLSSEGMKADIVSCRVGETTQFMTRDGCRARGGLPAS